MSNELGSTFLLRKEDILDSRFSDPTDFNTFVMVQKCNYFNSAHPCQGKFPKLWNSWEEAKNDILANGIRDPIKVRSIITPTGKKYKIVGNSIILGAAILAGLNEFLAIEVIQES